MKARSRPSRWLWIVLAWLAALLLLWLAFRATSPGQIAAVLALLKVHQLVILAALNAGILCLFAMRWWLILRILGYPLPFLRILAYRLTAFGITYFTPGPQLGGEPYQVWVVHRRHRVPVASALSAISLDKSLELFSNFSFLILGLLALVWAGLLPRTLGALLIGLAGVVLALLLLYLAALFAGRRPVAWVFRRFEAKPGAAGRRIGIRRTLEIAEELAASALHVRPRAMGGLALLAAATWLALGLEYWLAIGFLGARFGFAEVVMLMTAARLAFLLPMPAGLGTLEAGQMLVASALGAAPALGLGLSLLIRVRDVSFGLAGLALAALPQQKQTLTKSVEW